jgi:putative spermidine/putrescine transport system substrate-binding protein
MGGNRFFTKRTAQQFLRSSVLDRRSFLAGAATLGAASMLPARMAFAQSSEIPEFTGFPERLKGSGQLRIATAGGALAEAEHKAFIDYFAENSGIEIIETEGFSTAQIKAQVDTQSVQWDVLGLGRGNILPLVKQGEYFEDIDYSVVDWAGVGESDRKKESVAFFTLGTVMCYRTDAFDEQPTSWADFFDTTRFPGPRNWMSGSMGIAPQLEGALIADGVPMDQLYPLDVERALAALDRIKSDISVFWNSGAQSAQLMAENETVMGTAWNGRVSPLVADGLPVAISWSGAMFEQEHMVALKGTPNYENAMKFIAFALSPEAQARFSMFIPYGYVNQDAAALVPDSRKAILPSAHLSEGFWNDPEWWGANRDDAIERWAEWLLT